MKMHGRRWHQIYTSTIHSIDELSTNCIHYATEENRWSVTLSYESRSLGISACGSRSLVITNARKDETIFRDSVRWKVTLECRWWIWHKIRKTVSKNIMVSFINWIYDQRLLQLSWNLIRVATSGGSCIERSKYASLVRLIKNRHIPIRWRS